MPRTRTTLKPGHEHRVETGNTLAVKHGVHSRTLIEKAVPAKIEELFQQMPWLIDADYEGVKSFAYVCVQEDRLQAWIDADPDENGGTGGRGSLFTTRGEAKKIATLWKEIQLAKREWMKILAMGAGPRSQYAQAMSGAGKNMVEVRTGLKSLHSELQ